MKKGQQRFDHYLNQLQELLIKSSKQKNPALWLYANNARTPLFMLEGLAKLYAGIHNKKKFTKLKEHFKLLEDAIGAIDYYDSFAKEFIGNKKIPATVTNYLQAQSREKIQSLNEILKEKKWLAEDNTRIEKIRKKLSTADWQDEMEDIKSIHQFYIISINKILEFINQKDYQFTDVENDLHEFRRMIRWLSIYPQALLGCIQLSKSTTAAPKFLAKYLTKEITGSTYNVMPGAGDQKHFLLLDQNRFYALSWMIAETGKLKDNGLKVEVLKEAILQTTKSTETQALAEAYNLAGPKQMTIEQVLTASQNLIKTFCKEKNLEAMIMGTAITKP
ncbi:MAG: hypothetical protein IPL84_02520 [Chitinophagaceae bacterium]|nr:hypothetical protein [Chitinophagaceae bacterium]